ncbi:MAG TPA: GntR family transcriptional regulator [Candidatus Deferrimicrobiaceae bacterium]|nr:GntR family transcriptional regulator [Candidatus Deferrimicrobiaceae bacterium]
MTRQEVSRSVLSDQVKDRLLQAILDGRYPPGARIVETRVARELGTSQAPVREALRDLEGLGVIETTAFRGARVRRPSAGELLEAFAVRSVLESLAGRLAIEALTEVDLEELRGYVAEMQDAAEAGDVHREAIADAAFHGRIIELAGNATLARVWRTLEPFSRTYITIVAPGSDRRRIADGHEPVLEALRRRDPDLVTAVLHRHFEDAAASLASHWPSATPTPPEESGDPGRGGTAPETLPDLAASPSDPLPAN